jgi:hypothetical protein
MHTIITIAQSSVVAALQGSSEVLSDVQGIYDKAPEQSPLPYITISDVTAARVATVGDLSYRVVVTVTYHQRYNGKAESLNIIGNISAALNNTQSADSMFIIIVSDVHIVSQQTEVNQNLLRTDVVVELYITKMEVTS